MNTQDQGELLKEGMIVNIMNSGFHQAIIAEYRGPFGPKGAHVYRVLVQKKPRRMYIEVLENQIEVVKAFESLPIKASESSSHPD